MRVTARAQWLLMLIFASACAGSDRTTTQTVTPAAPADAATTDIAGPETSTLAPCPVWSDDELFYSRMPSSGAPIAAWGLSDDDIHLLLSGAPVAAHWDGVAWTAGQLPPGYDYVAISGTSATDLWLLARISSDQRAVVLRNDGPNGGWTRSPLGYPYAFDMVMLGPGDGLIATSPTITKGQGVVLRLSGGAWAPLPSPDLGAPYTIVRLYRLDATHVYGIGESVTSGWGDVNDVLAAFDGSSWSAIRMPEGLGFRKISDSGLDVPGQGLQAVAAASPDRVYALANPSYAPPSEERLYRVSADLSAWTPVVEGQIGTNTPTLAVTGGGTLVGVWQDNSGIPAPVRMLTVRDGAVGRLCTASLSVSPTLVWSAPGSPNVHLFGQSRDAATPHHLIARIDP
jgi:hypothetical protein